VHGGGHRFVGLDPIRTNGRSTGIDSLLEGVPVSIQAAPKTGMTSGGAGSGSASPAMGQVLRQARQAFVCDAVSVLRRSSPGVVDLVASTDGGARQADQLQVAHDEGPTLSVRDDAVCLSGDTSADERWPLWGPAVARLGWFSVLSTPLLASGLDFGVLTLYARRPAAFDATHAYAARIFAQNAAAALAYAREAEGLREAVHSRHRIGLAQGILMEQHGLDAEEAFDMLRRHSQANNVKVRAVAEHVIATGSFPMPTAARTRQRRTPAA
jgi:GAF domain-containing protein